MSKKEKVSMNKVYLNEQGQLFVNGHKIKNVKSVSSKTDWIGTSIIIELKGDYKSDFQSKVKEHSLDECSKE